jgi:impB/mucB/samB family C-terminal domain
MQTCIDSTAPPFAIPVPAWTLRVARPATDRLRRSGALLGVPRPALQTIFGKSMGRRLWDQARSKVGTRPTDAVLDSEVSAGMIAYASQQAADTLRRAGRQAKGLAVTILYTDGETKRARARLARSTNAADKISGAAIGLLRQIPLHDAPIAAIRLSTTTVETVDCREAANNLDDANPPTA